MTESKIGNRISDIGEIGKKWGVVVLVGLVGLGLLGYGVWEGVRGAGEEAVVEIVREGEGAKTAPVQVDVGGAVQNPGVYTLSTGARIGEAISVAGGLSEQADKEWVSRYLNLAEEVKDGGKIYIPPEGDGEVVNSNIENSNVGGEQGKVNINTASVSELDSLWGVGEARAQAIVDNRPYASVEELVDKAKIPSNVFEAIKDEIGVY